MYSVCTVTVYPFLCIFDKFNSFSVAVEEIAPAENGISSGTAIVTEVDDYENYNITIDKMALSADDSVHVDGWVPSERIQYGNCFKKLVN